MNVNLALDSSEVLGGGPAVLYRVAGPPGVGRVLTLASSTIDAGTLGTRDLVNSVRASTDNTAGNAAIINAEGSILVEAPAATTGDATLATAAVNCFQSEVPDTTQVASGTNGAINCATGTSGNTFTAALGLDLRRPRLGLRAQPELEWRRQRAGVRDRAAVPVQRLSDRPARQPPGAQRHRHLPAADPRQGRDRADRPPRRHTGAGDRKPRERAARRRRHVHRVGAEHPRRRPAQLQLAQLRRRQRHRARSSRTRSPIPVPTRSR